MARKTAPAGDDGTATIYARISIDKTGEQLAVERQVKACRDFCEEHGWTVREVFEDNSRSATTGGPRPAFDALLASRPARIVVWHTDRLARLTEDLDKVITLGVPVHAVQAGYFDLTTPAGRATAKTVTTWAQYEVEQKTLRQLEATKQKAERGLPHWPTRPFGLELDGTLRLSEAAVLREVYERFLRGESISSIARWLNESEVWTTSGVKWSPQVLSRFLRNPRNAGLRVHLGRIVGKGTWEPVVTETTFWAAQRLLNMPSRKTGSDGLRKYLLSGLARCAEPGCNLPAKGGTPARTGLYAGDPLYTCAAGHFALPIEWVDGIVIRRFMLVLEDPENRHLWRQRADDAASERPALEEELRRLSEVRKGLTEDYADALITRDEMRAGMERAKASQEALQARLDALEDAGEWADFPETEFLYEWFYSQPWIEQRRLIARHLSVRLVRRGKGSQRPLSHELVRVERIKP